VKIDRVTFTGADDGTSIEEMLALSDANPIIEWGILFSARLTGHPRYPSMRWVDDLLSESQKRTKPRLSAHVCGRWVRDLMRGIPLHSQSLDIGRIPSQFLSHFQRIQLNFHAEPGYEMAPAVKNVLPLGSQAIFQIEGVNDPLFKKALEFGMNAVPLFDKSGGAGMVPDEWPSPMPGIYCGYAGGLGPDTMEKELEKISSVVGDGTIWIDMERRVRTDNEEFDLGKVRRVLEIVGKWALGNRQ
jgi:hypothetical protein